MTQKIRLTLAAVVLATLSACGGPATTAAPSAAPPSGASGPTSTPATSGDGAATSGDEAAVEAAFRGYYQALLDRDFAAACMFNAPETQAKLVENVKSGGSAAATCEEAFSAIYAVPGAGEAADGIARTTELKDITVTGETATITWSAEFQGKRPTITSGARKIDGEWRLLDASG